MDSATTSDRRPLRAHRWVAVRALLLALPISGSAVAHEGGGSIGVHMTKEEALEEVAFPGADRIERRTLFLERAEQKALSERAQSPFDSRLQTVYVGYRNGNVTGYAVIDTDIVRSKMATYLIVMEPDGELRHMRILAWQEPPEYEPPQRWLDLFKERRLDDGPLRVGRDIHAMSGATLSVHMLTEHVRRALALHDVLLEQQADEPR